MSKEAIELSLHAHDKYNKYVPDVLIDEDGKASFEIPINGSPMVLVQTGTVLFP